MSRRKVFSITIMLLLLTGMAVSPGQVDVAQAAATVTYNLYATDGFISMADGTVVYIYGFVGGRAGVPLTFQNSAAAKVAPNGITTITAGAPAPTGGPVTAAELPLAGNAQFPAPIIYANAFDIVQINLKNLGVANKTAPNGPHTIHLHGLDVQAANDGVPETSVAAVPANAKALGAGNIVVYMFTTTNPGTYMYHCHQEASIHVQMGMYGALVIYNSTDAAASIGPGSGLGGSLWGWNYDKDYVLLLSEFDLGQHVSEQQGNGGNAAFNPVNYKPQYWFINGLSFPQTIHAGFPAGYTWAMWAAAHPGYDPFIMGSVSKPSFYWGTKGEKVLIRVINMGYEAQPMHMHGYHGKVLASDARAWDWANTPKGKFGLLRPTPFGQGLEKQTLLIGSGETFEWLVDLGQQTLQSTYPAGTYSKVDGQGAPALNTSANPAIEGYIGGPVVGPTSSDLNSDAAQLAGGAIPGQLFPFHNHDDYKATNNGVYPGGMFTMIMTLP